MESGFSEIFDGAVIDIDGIKELKLPPKLRGGARGEGQEAG